MSTDWIGTSPWAALWPEGYDRRILDETDSTMAEAARIAPPDRPTWIMARHQTAARGRRGRAWVMPEGNFAATLILRPERPAREAALTSFVAAVVLRGVLREWVDAKALTLKWPNDVLLNGRKVAGILLESSGRGDRLDWLAVGIGVNLAAAPPAEALEPGALAPIALAEAAPWPRFEDDPDHEAELFLAHLALSMSTHLDIWDEAGFEAIRALWLAGHGARKGARITARTPRETIHGRFEALDDDGRLVLLTESGTRRIAAAEIHFDEG